MANSETLYSSSFPKEQIIIFFKVVCNPTSAYSCCHVPLPLAHTYLSINIF